MMLDDLPTAGQVAAGAELVEALVRLVTWLASWLRSDPSTMPESAALAALAAQATRPLAASFVLCDCVAKFWRL